MAPEHHHATTTACSVIEQHDGRMEGNIADRAAEVLRFLRRSNRQARREQQRHFLEGHS